MHTKRRKKWIAFFLSAVMMVTSLPAGTLTAAAAEGDGQQAQQAEKSSDIGVDGLAAKAAGDDINWEDYDIYDVEDLDVETEVVFNRAAEYTSKTIRVETHHGQMAGSLVKYAWFAYSADGDKKDLEEDDRRYSAGLMEYFSVGDSGKTVRKLVDRYECEVTLTYDDEVLKTGIKKFPVSYEPLTVTATRTAITLRQNGKATLKVSAVNHDTSYCKGGDFQWYRVKADGTEQALEDETADTLKVKVTDPTDSFKCVVTPKIVIGSTSSLKGLNKKTKKIEKTFDIYPMSGYRIVDMAPESLSAEIDEPKEFFVKAEVDEENGYTLSYQWEKHSYESAFSEKRTVEEVGHEAKLTVKASDREDFKKVYNDYAKDSSGEYTNTQIYNGWFNYKLIVSVSKDNEKLEEYCYYFELNQSGSYTDNYYKDDLNETIYLQKGESVTLSLDSKTANGYRAEKAWYQMVAEEQWYFEKVYNENTGKFDNVKTYLTDGFQEPDLSGTEYIEDYDIFDYEVIDGHNVYTSKFYQWIEKADSYVVSGDDKIPGEYICRIFLYYKDEEEADSMIDSRVFKVKYLSELTAYAKSSEVGASLGTSADLEVVAANRNTSMYPITYTWSKLKTETGEYEEIEAKGAVYHIDSVAKSDFGTYQVLVDDGAEEKTVTIVLSEEDLKTVVYTPEKSYYRKAVGETIDLKADILFPEGVKPFYEWYRYEKFSTSGDSYESGAGQTQDAEYWELLNQDENHYKVSIVGDRDYTQYKCIVSYKNKNTVYSQEFIYDVAEPYAVELERMTPSSQAKKMGDSATYRVRLITDDPSQSAYTYQWYRREDGKRTDIEGATKAEYQIASLKAEDFSRLYCEVKQNTDDPEEAKVLATVHFDTMLYTTASLESSYETKQVKLGEDVTLEPVILKGESYNFTYQWYRYDPDDNYSDAEKIHGATKLSYQLTNIGRNELTRYRCNIQLDGADVMSYSVRLEEDDTKPEITIEPEYEEDQTMIRIDAVLGKSVKMEIKAESPDDLELKYQWYVKETNYLTWNAIGDATSPSYSIDVVKSVDLRDYKCVVTDTEGNQADRVFRLIGTTNMDVTSDALNVGDMLGYEVTLGGDVTLSATATIDSEYELYYQWYHREKDQDGVYHREYMYGEKNASLTLSNIQEKDLGVYYCEVYDAKGNSQTLSYLVYFDTGLNVVPGVRYPGVRADGTVRMYVRATANAGENITYQWSKLEEVEDEDGDTSYEYVDIKDAVSAEYIVSKLTEDTAGEYCLTTETRGETSILYFEIRQLFTLGSNRTWAEQGDELEITQKFINPYADEEYIYEWYARETATGTMRRIPEADGLVLKTTAPKFNLNALYNTGYGYKTVDYQCIIKKKGEKAGEEETISSRTVSVNVLPRITYDSQTMPETNHPNDEMFSVKGFRIDGAKQLKITFDKETDLGTAELLMIDSTGEAVWKVVEDASEESAYYVDGDKVIFLMINTANRDLSYGYKVASIEEMKEPVVIDNSCKCQTTDQIVAAALAAMKAGSTAASGGAVSGPAVTTAKAVPKKGSKKTVNKITYRVTKSAKKNGTVAVASVHKSLKKVTLGATVKLNGYTFKITSIDKKAFSKAANLSSVTIGKNVKSIGASAFAGRKKLKKIVIKATGLKKIGKKAFSKVPKKAVATVPKKQKKAYKKLLKKAGFRGKVK